MANALACGHQVHFARANHLADYRDCRECSTSPANIHVKVCVGRCVDVAQLAYPTHRTANSTGAGMVKKKATKAQWCAVLLVGQGARYRDAADVGHSRLNYVLVFTEAGINGCTFCVRFGFTTHGTVPFYARLERCPSIALDKRRFICGMWLITQP